MKRSIKVFMGEIFRIFKGHRKILSPELSQFACIQFHHNYHDKGR